MMARKEITRTALASAFTEPPAAGDVFASVSGTTVFVVDRVRQMIGAVSKVNGRALRLYGHRVSAATLAPGTVTKPWPSPVKAASKAAMPQAMGPHQAPVSPAAKQQATRRHVMGLKKAATADSQLAVPGHQIATLKVTQASWVDPDDVNPLRRRAREVQGYRSTSDSIKHLQDIGSITKKQAYAAARLRRSYEAGALGCMPHADWSSTPTGYGSGAGPSEIKLQNLERFQQAMAALGRLADVVLQICLEGETISGYATRTRVNRQSICGRLGAALDRLLDHWDDLDERAKRLAEAHQPQVAAQ
jgi:hypothetical protein